MAATLGAPMTSFQLPLSSKVQTSVPAYPLQLNQLCELGVAHSWSLSLLLVNHGDYSTLILFWTPMSPVSSSQHYRFTVT
jgi:hypothetical protein